MPRFVILQHESPRGCHWDFMLEARDALATWSMAEPPDAASAIPAEALPDHRMAYLEYEGPISAGRGSVTRWDHGTFELRRYDRDQVIAVVAGKRLIGEVTIRCTPDAPSRWTFSYTPYA